MGKQVIDWEPHRCGAKLKPREGMENGAERTCNNWAMRGAPRCRLHGGSLPNVKEAARQRITNSKVMRACVTYGIPVDVDPATALLEEIQRTAGHVRWLENVIANMEEGELVWGKIETNSRSGYEDMQNWDEEKMGAVENIWLRLYFRERQHLAQITTKALALGIAEKQVQIAAAVAGMIEMALLGVLEDMGHSTADPNVRASIAKRMLEASRSIPAA